MFCANCGKEINSNFKVCPYCGNEVKETQQEPVQETTVQQAEATATNGESSNYSENVENSTVVGTGFYGAPAPTVGVNPTITTDVKSKKEKYNKIFTLSGILSGILSIVFGIVELSMDVGSYVFCNSYGGDAYTGIQNAAAITATNIKSLATIAKCGFGFILIALGVIAIIYFITKYRKNSTDGTQAENSKDLEI